MPIPAGFEHIVRENEPLAPHTWLRLGGAAQYFAEPTSVDELADLVRRCHEAGLPVRVLGGGSDRSRWRRIPGSGSAVRPSISRSRQASMSWRTSFGDATKRGCRFACWAADPIGAAGAAYLAPARRCGPVFRGADKRR